jgi:hypothetical protein
MNSNDGAHLPPGISSSSASSQLLLLESMAQKHRHGSLLAARFLPSSPPPGSGQLPRPGIFPPLPPSLATRRPSIQRAGNGASPPSSPESSSMLRASKLPVKSKAKYGPAPAKGALTIVHNLYQSAPDAHDVWTWVDEYPIDIKEAAEDEETEKCAIIVRNVKCTDGRRKTKAHSMIIQSPHLKMALSEILHDYPGVCCELQRLEFSAPFEPFVHRWAAFLKYWKRDDLSDMARQHIDLLHDILQGEIGEDVREFEDFVLNGVVTFKSLWMIFQPGSIVLSTHEGETLSAFELSQSIYTKDSCGELLSILSDVVAWDGKNFGRRSESLSIRCFEGTKRITSLYVYPLHFHEHKENIKAGLIERGKAFEELAGFNFKA